MDLEPQDMSRAHGSMGLEGARYRPGVVGWSRRDPRIASVDATCAPRLVGVGGQGVGIRGGDEHSGEFGPRAAARLKVVRKRPDHESVACGRAALAIKEVITRVDREAGPRMFVGAQ